MDAAVAAVPAAPPGGSALIRTGADDNFAVSDVRDAGIAVVVPVPHTAPVDPAHVAAVGGAVAGTGFVKERIFTLACPSEEEAALEDVGMVASGEGKRASILQTTVIAAGTESGDGNTVVFGASLSAVRQGSPSAGVPPARETVARLLFDGPSGMLGDWVSRCVAASSGEEAAAWEMTGCMAVRDAILELRALVQDNIAHVAEAIAVAEARPRGWVPGMDGVPAWLEHAHLLFQRNAMALSSLEEAAFPLTFAAAANDFDRATPGNGYRSLLAVATACMNKLIVKHKAFRDARGGFLFSSSHHCGRVQDYVRMLEMMSAVLHLARDLSDGSPSSCLFQLTPDPRIVEGLESMPKDIFYAKRFGFQYPSSIRTVLKVILVAMASYSYGYNSYSNALVQKASSLLAGPRYFFGATARSTTIATEIESGNVHFVKAFWNLTETTIAKHFSKVVAPLMSINMHFTIPIVRLPVPTRARSSISVEVPSEGASSIPVRLISYEWYEGQMYDPSHMKKQGYADARTLSSPRPISSGLLIHIHGGGFVAQSSKSHEAYLRFWAKSLRVPILSIDYSLAPEAPYPRAFEECMYVYAWALRNGRRLGSTVERVVLAGDSAGANLCLAVALKSRALGMRAPDGLMLSYPPVLVRYTPSPARILSVMDPLLSLGVLKNCLGAYAGKSAETTDPYLSPWFADDAMIKALPSTSLVVGSLDPLLDDSIEFARRARSLGVDLDFHVFENLPHGFLSFARATEHTAKALDHCIARLQAMFGRVRL